MKRTVTEDILSKVAIGLESDHGAKLNYDIEETVIPNRKSILEYESALDRAVRKFFLYGNDDDILLVLKDARKNQLIPMKYKSLDLKKFSTYDVEIRKASLSFEKERISIRFFFNFGGIHITASKVIITGKIKLTASIGKIIAASQETIEKMQKILKS